MSDDQKPLLLIKDKRCMTIAITGPRQGEGLQVFQEGLTAWISGDLKALRALMVEVQDCVRILETGEVHPDPGPTEGGGIGQA